MITQAQMYWLTRLDSIHGCMIPFVFIAVFSAIGFVLSMILYILARDNQENELAKNLKNSRRVCSWIFLVSFLICVITTIFLPTTKEMAAILVVPRIVNSEKIQTVGNKIYDLAVEWMEELRPKNARKAEDNK
ncbi:MAG: hypothetical protein J6Q22_10080 [Prevotella sp.]|nr:hypothetical protein [Prevotella sp.]